MSRTAFLVLTTRCNQSCSYCFNKQLPFNKRREDLIEMADFDKLADSFLQLNTREVVLTGGEPLLLNKKLISLIKILTDKGIICSLDTNGTLFNQETIDDLSQAGLKNIYLSTKYLKTINSSIINLLKNKFKLSLIHVFDGKEYLDLPRVVEDYKKITDSIVFQPAWFENSKNGNCISRFSSEEWTQMENVLQNISLQYKQNLDYMRSAYERGGRKPERCHIGKKNFVVYNDGGMYCCFHRQDLKIGNILKDTVELLNSNLLKAADEICEANCFGSHCFSLFL